MTNVGGKQLCSLIFLKKTLINNILVVYRFLWMKTFYRGGRLAKIQEVNNSQVSESSWNLPYSQGSSFSKFHEY